jgi:phosphohistidine phosphatase SixA
MITRRHCLACLAASTLPFTGPARASVPAAFAAALATPGTHVILRHARAPGTGDPPAFRLGDCSTQRNLDTRGRAQARRLGDMLRATDAPFDAVLTSEWCRCRDTAALLDLGPVTAEPVLNSFFAGRGDRTAQTRALRDLLRGAGDRRLVLVTHQVNITALTGSGVASGEAFAIRMGDGDRAEVLARILPPALPAHEKGAARRRPPHPVTVLPTHRSSSASTAFCNSSLSTSFSVTPANSKM